LEFWGRVGRILGVRAARPFIGILRFNDAHQGEDSKPWLLKVYGANNLLTLHALAQQLDAEFKVTIVVRLIDETEQIEYSWGSWN